MIIQITIQIAVQIVVQITARSLPVTQGLVPTKPKWGMPRQRCESPSRNPCWLLLAAIVVHREEVVRLAMPQRLTSSEGSGCYAQSCESSRYTDISWTTWPCGDLQLGSSLSTATVYLARTCLAPFPFSFPRFASIRQCRLFKVIGVPRNMLPQGNVCFEDEGNARPGRLQET